MSTCIRHPELGECPKCEARRRGEKLGCSGLNAAGDPCGAPVMHGSDPPICNRHSYTDEEWHAAAVAKGKWSPRKIERLGAKIRDEQERREVLRGLLCLLDSEELRAIESGVLAIVLAFKIGNRDELLELLPSIDREHLSPHERALEALQAAETRLLDLHKAGAISAEELPSGLLTTV